MSTLNHEDGAAALAPGTVIDGRYKVVRAIGQGGNGMVHEVEHVRTGRRLALKSLLDEAGYGRLEQEARATSLIANAHASKITDMGTSPQTGPYLVMELLEGQSLRQLLDDAGQLPLELMVNIALQVCECLEEAHRHGIVHRDLKPENVFLCKSSWPGQHDVRVLDFGVVKISNDGPIPNNSLTRTGSTVGTPYYMSLEQLRNSSAVDARADIYALGVVLYESLSGRKPFQAETIGDLVYALCSGPPTHLARLRPDLPTETTEMIMRALSANKEDRPKSMTELGAALLPHGNSAFGLWLKADSKQAALGAKGAGKPATGASTAVHTPSAVGKPGAPVAPRPFALKQTAKMPITGASALPGPSASATAGVAPVAGAVSTGSPVGGPHSAGSPVAGPPVTPGAAPLPAPPVRPVPGAAKTMSLWTDAALEGGPAPGTVLSQGPQAASADPSDDTTEGGPRRDTPTEMYTKDLHDSPEAPTGDRDTPTRAIPAPNFDDARARSALTGAKSGFGGDEPTGELPNAVGSSPGMPADPALMRTLPASSLEAASGSFELPPNPAMLSTVPLHSSPMSESPFKPGWQRALDNALVSVGRTVDGWIVKFRAAPKQTQTLVIVGASSVGLLFLVLLFFVIVR